MHRVAIVTGAGGGLGEATARRLAEAGAGVAVVDRDGLSAERVAKAIEAEGRRACGLQADVTVKTAVLDMVDEVNRRAGPPDILVNNVGGFSALKTLVEIEEDEWDAILRLNLKTPTSARGPCCRG